jgi:hypothetical protein
MTPRYDQPGAVSLREVTRLSRRSLTRQALDFLPVVSLASCFILALVWVMLADTLRSTDVGMPIRWDLFGRTDFALVAGRRHIGLMQRRQVDPVVWAPSGLTPAEQAQWSQQFGRDGEGEFLGFAGGGRVHLSRSKTGRLFYSGWERWAAVPYGLPVLLTAILPAMSVRRRLRRRRFCIAADRRRCPACGCDLRATPGRCPECGQVPSRAAA